jgi:hypothetical protein
MALTTPNPNSVSADDAEAVRAAKTLADASYEQYDLVGMTPDKLAWLLGARAGGFTMFVSSDSNINEHGNDARKANFPFVRISVDQGLLLKLGRALAHCRTESATTSTYARLPSPRGLPAAGQPGEVDDCYWELVVTANTFYFKATDSGSPVFESISIDTCALLTYLYADKSPDNDYESVAIFARDIGPYVLLADYTDNTFVDVVAAAIPEVQAEVTAAAMRERVEASAFSGLDELEQPTSKRARRRMGV